MPPAKRAVPVANPVTHAAKSVVRLAKLCCVSSFCDARHGVCGAPRQDRRGPGRSKDAERAFQTVFQAYLDHHLGYDAALVSIDLALLYAREGRTTDLKALAGRMHPIFATEEVHREVAAALLLFQEAADREAATLGLLENLSAYLGRPRESRASVSEGRSNPPRLSRSQP